jgi:NitT/TauT family transport system substrate-binding protein
MSLVRVSLLRGICQTPAYIAEACGYFRELDLDVRLQIEPTASTVPDKLLAGGCDFAVIPWTRVAVAARRGQPLVLVAGSGCAEAALVVRRGLHPDAVRRVAVPLRGGIKDLTAIGLFRALGWQTVDTLSLPSGDGAILALIGEGADAASMVEPYATMMEMLDIGTVHKRTGDLWPGVPGCSLTTTAACIDAQPELVRRVVAAFVRGARHVCAHPAEAAVAAAPYIGVHARFVEAALGVNRPDVRAICRTDVMGEVLQLMIDLGYIDGPPAAHYRCLTFLDEAVAALG